MSSLHTAWFKVVSGQQRGPCAALMRVGLTAASVPYRTAVALRNTAYSHGLLAVHRLPRPVISIGNLTAGGTGKTPLAIDLAQRLRAMDARPAILLRGYRGAAHAADASSDEALLLRAALAHIATVEAHPDRVSSARAVLQRDPQVNVFLLDDGFQHRRVHRDLNLVLVDATNPFGFDALLPRGLLREPGAALRRADGVIVTRADLIPPDQRLALDQRIAALAGRRPLAHVAFAWTGFRDAAGRSHDLQALRDVPVLAVCGIGNPHAFAATARAHLPALRETIALDDHHAYTASEVCRQFVHRAGAAGAQALLTTEKDWVKWEPLLVRQPIPLPVYRPVVAAQYLDGEDELNERLTAVMTA